METLKPIGHIETPFRSKFGIPRQPGIVETPGTVVFEPEYRVAEAVRGLEGFDYIWLLWGFSESAGRGWSPTVRPPRLGGNERMGVFATRSPFRPNPIGLSSVRLREVRQSSPRGPLLIISGADLMDGTPIYDIKPYLPYTDSHPEARSGFATRPAEILLRTECPPELLLRLPAEARESLFEILAHDPRPQYQHDPEREYGMDYGGLNIRFKVCDGVAEITAVTATEK